MFKLFFTLYVAFSMLFQTTMCFDAQEKLNPLQEYNKEHLKEDLGGIIGKTPDEMSPEELQFHYFRQHDYDGDDTLDGNEIIMSLTHHTESANEKTDKPESDEELSNMVDEILKFQDKNDDGKITFQEYVSPYQDKNSLSEDKTKL